MPNHVDNKLSVLGPPKSVSAFVATARGRRPKSGDKDGENATVGDGPEVPLNFHSLVPLPEEYGTNPYGDMSARSGINLEREAWGIKWGAYRDQREPECEPGLATYAFRTAWNGPHIIFMPKVAKRFPGLLFLLSWGGEGPTRGRALFTGRRTIGGEEKDRNEVYPVWCDDDGNELPGGYEKYKAVQNARLATHLLWVGWIIAHRAGRTFEPVGCAPVLADWLQENGWKKLAATVREMDPATDPNPVLLTTTQGTFS